eukprot:TRINITY_DN62233_c0_g1_i1.p1 TRINITY_DN62233_c0_g1~~TRINITY_DN62233_c0_g1_i1.p1  ORF type:complete len:543 (-),score=-13.83 TRINITY_DN62233_c0_g1_i1:146-1774(-)
MRTSQIFMSIIAINVIVMVFYLQNHPSLSTDGNDEPHRTLPSHRNTHRHSTFNFAATSEQPRRVSRTVHSSFTSTDNHKRTEKPQTVASFPPPTCRLQSQLDKRFGTPSLMRGVNAWARSQRMESLQAQFERLGVTSWTKVKQLLGIESFFHGRRNPDQPLVLLSKLIDWKVILPKLQTKTLMVNWVQGSEVVEFRDKVVRNLRTWYREHGCESQADWFVPKQFLLSDEMECTAFQRYIHQAHPAVTSWAIKKIEVHEGKGIHVTHDPNAYFEEHPLKCEGVAQEYLKPFLWNGTKFDFRTLMLIASTDPWVVFWRPLHARRSMVPYVEGVPFSETTKTMHISNWDVQSKLANFSIPDHMLNWHQLAEEVERQGYMSAAEWKVEMKRQLMEHTQVIFQSTRAHMKVNSGQFGLFAFDFMLNSDLQFKLLELNINFGLFPVHEFNKGMIDAVYTETIALVWGIQTGVLAESVDSLGYGDSIAPNGKFGVWELVFDERWGVDYVQPDVTPVERPCPCAPKVDCAAKSASEGRFTDVCWRAKNHG